MKPPLPELAGCALLLGLLAPGVNARDDVLAPTFADPQRREKLAEAFPELERIAQRWRERNNVPGLAWGVIIDGELAKSGGVGVSDLARNTPVDADSVFRIASMTKSFTALAILMLRDEGKLQLDAPVAQYVPELASLAPMTRDAGPITIRHLLTHTAGFPEDNAWGDRQLAVPEEQMSRWLVAGIPSSTAPGTAWEYSNYGFAILGRVVANASGLKYRDFVDQRILAPLGMSSTYWEAKDVPKARLATAYREQDGKHVREITLEDGAFGPAGGLFTSSRDLARWVAWMLAAHPARDDPEKPPALRRSVREMQQGSAGFPQLWAHRRHDAPLWVYTSVYGYGLIASRTCDHAAVEHPGALPGYGSIMLWLPGHGVGLFGMANLTYAVPYTMVDEMLGALRRTGGLEPRRAQPSPALSAAVRRVASLINDWKDADARALAADNLFIDEPLESRRAAVTALRKDLGRCESEPLETENALRGRFRMSCKRGWIDVSLTMAPTQPPTVQSLVFTSGKPLTSALQSSVASVVDAMHRGARGLALKADTSRDSIGALLVSARAQYGSCRVGPIQEGDGETHARVRLECDRGPLDLSIGQADSKIESVQFDPPQTAVCTP